MEVTDKARRQRRLGGIGAPLLVAFLLAVLFYSKEQKRFVPSTQEVAIFSGAHFWYLEQVFDLDRGVISTESGYLRPSVKPPTEEQIKLGKFPLPPDIEYPSFEKVALGQSPYMFALKVTFDPRKTTYENILDLYFKNINPFQDDGQFCDIGKQYRAAIFPQLKKQEVLAKVALNKLKNTLPDGKSLALKIERDKYEFFLAEHKYWDYYQAHPEFYVNWRRKCAVDQTLEELRNPPKPKEPLPELPPGAFPVIPKSRT